jgi:hypothetical protein
VNNLRLEKGIDTPLFNGDILRFGVNVDRGQGMLLSDFYADHSNPVTDIFEAIQVRYEIEWAKPDIVVIPDDTVFSKTTLSPSTNTFTVPDDEDESDADYDFDSDEEDDKVDDQHVDHPSDDSKESIARTSESAVLQHAETSSVSSMDKSADKSEERELKPESKIEPKLEPRLQFQPYPAPVENLSFVEEVSFGLLSPSGPEASDIVKSLSSEPTSTLLSDIKPLAIPTTDSLQPAPQKTDTELLRSDIKPSSCLQTDKFPETCYQKVPENSYSNWIMMRPMFMRLADMAWGESDHIPDVDYEKRIIHAARRCSLSRESYWVDDSPNFQPWAGTEVMWTPDSDASDTSFHRMPGNSLKYWAIDKRRYWIIYEDEDGLDMSNWWWIVEKPWGVLSEETKEQLLNETKVDECHKCWFVRAWEPQVIGNSWCESPPYWDSNFDEELPSDDESVDSDDADQDFEDDEENMDDSTASELEDYPFFNFNDESYGYNNEDYSNSEEDSEVDEVSEDSEYSPDVMEEEEGNWEKDERSCDKDLWGSEASEESASDDDSESPDDLEMELTNPPKYSSNALPDQTPVTVKRSRFVDDDIELPGNHMAEAGPSSLQYDCEDETTKLQDKIIKLRDEITKEQKWMESGQALHPRTPRVPLFGRANASYAPLMTNPDAQFPEHTVSDKLPSSCQDHVLHLNPETSTIPVVISGSRAYQDGPFSINTNFPSQKYSLPSEPTPMAGNLKRTASDMESSVLEESEFSQDAQRVPREPISQPDLQTTSTEVQEAITSALAENNRPAKRVKSNHSSSGSFASHATTAVVGAVVGGLGAIAALAALPNGYFQ